MAPNSSANAANRRGMIGMPSAAMSRSHPVQNSRRTHRTSRKPGARRGDGRFIGEVSSRGPGRLEQFRQRRGPGQGNEAAGTRSAGASLLDTRRFYMGVDGMRETRITLPELGLVAGTRGML